MKASSMRLFLILLYVFFLVLLTVSVNSCKPVLRQDIFPDNKEASGEAAGPAGNNYQGLRMETLNMDHKEAAEHSPRIICFGDSVTFGWNVEYKNSYPRVLKRLLEVNYREVEVINSGIGGDTIIEAWNRLDDDILDFNPLLVIINFGLNDGILLKTDENGNKNNTNKSLLDKSKLTSRVDIETFEKTYNDIIDRLKAGDIGIIILGTNPILDNKFDDRNYFEEQIISFEKYNKKARQVSGSNGIPFIGLWDIFLKDGQTEQLMAGDGFHPNETGLELIAESVYGLIMDSSFIKDKTVD